MEYLITGAKAVLAGIGSLMKLKAERRMKLAEFLTAAASVIEEIAKLSTERKAEDDGNYRIHALCVELAELGERISEIAEGRVPLDEVQHLGRIFRAGTLGRMMAVNSEPRMFEDSKERKAKLNKALLDLAECSGTLRAISATLRAQ